MLAEVGWVGEVDLAVGSTYFKCVRMLGVREGDVSEVKLPRIGAPLPLSSMGWPWVNCSRLTTPASVEDVNNTLATKVWNFMMSEMSDY